MQRRTLAAAVVVTTALSLVGCTGGHSRTSPRSGASTSRTSSPSQPGVSVPGGGVADAANIPNAGALATAADGLPKDPAAATDALAAKLFGPDAKAAVAAAGVLLVRAGIPLVSADGPVIALPSPIVIVNAPTDVELLPNLVDQVRQNVRYTPAQVLAIMKYLGLSEQHLTAAQLVGTLSTWGKTAGAPQPSVYAGAIERALAFRHGQVLTASAAPDPATVTALGKGPGGLADARYYPLAAPGGAVDFDPLQLLVLLAHATSDASDNVTVAHGRAPYPTPSGHSSVTEAMDDGCDALVNLMQTEPGRIDQKFTKTALQDAIGDAIEKKYGQAAGTLAGKAFKAVEKFEDVAAYLLFTVGLQFSLTADKAKTHFRHESSQTDRDVLFTAHAGFNLKIPQKWLSCWTLAGLQIPKNKGLKGFEVNWREPNGPVALRPYSQDADKLLKPVVLDDSGDTTLKTYPRVEAHAPGPGYDPPVSTVYQQVYAGLDKDYLGAHLSDLLPMLAGPEGVPPALIAIAYNNIVGLIKEAGLPNKQVDFPVDYHGANVFRAQGDGSMNVLFEGTVGVAMDLYSCTGPGGPWQGTISVTGATGPILIALGKMAGKNLEGSGTDVAPVTFQLDPKSTQTQHRPVAGTKYEVLVELDSEYIKNGFTPDSAQDQAAMLYGRLQVGTASWAIAGVDLREMASMLSPLFASNMDVPVYRTNSDPRCKGGSLQDDPF